MDTFQRVSDKEDNEVLRAKVGSIVSVSKLDTLDAVCRQVLARYH